MPDEGGETRAGARTSVERESGFWKSPEIGKLLSSRLFTETLATSNRARSPMADDSPRALLTFDFSCAADAVRVVLSYPPTRGALLAAARERAEERMRSNGRAASTASSVKGDADTTSGATLPIASTSHRSASRQPAPIRWWEAVDVNDGERGVGTVEEEVHPGDASQPGAVDEKIALVHEKQKIPKCTEKRPASSRPGWRGGGIAPNRRNAHTKEIGSVTATQVKNPSPVAVRTALIRSSQKENESKRAVSKAPKNVSETTHSKAPPRVRAKARATLIASRERAGSVTESVTASKSCGQTVGNRIGGVPSTLALVKCSNCGTKSAGVAVVAGRNNSKRDGLFRDQGIHIGSLPKAAQRKNVAKFITEPLSGKDFVPCKRCGDVFYCDEKCTKQDWPRHRKNECAGVRHGFGAVDGSCSGDINLGYVKGERKGSRASDVFLQTSIARGR